MKNSLVDGGVRTLGDQSVGALGYGCWRLVNMSPKAAQARLEGALDAGMNLIDTADVYGLDWGGSAFGEAEALMGDVFARAPGLRDRMFLATKGGIVPGTPYDSEYLEAACDASLGRLGVEYVDLYQIHRPDLLAHPERTARVLERLLSSGKVRHVGVSNYSPTQTAALMAHLPGKIVSQQSEFSASHLEPLFNGVCDQCMQFRQSFLAWSPLGGGTLATDRGSHLAAILDELALREQVDRAILCLAFVLAHPARPIALVGSTDPARIVMAAKAKQVVLTRADVYRVIEASMGESLP